MADCVVITGASSGLGQALAVRMAMDYVVIAIGRDEKGLEQTQNVAKPGKVYTINADLSDNNAYDSILKQFDSEISVKYLIHCAATLEPIQPLASVPQHQLQANLNVNLLAPIVLTQKLKPYFSASSRVLCIGSDYAHEVKKRADFGAYAISKSGLATAATYFSEEYKASPDNDLPPVGYLSPGPMQTSIFFQFHQYLNIKGVKNSTTTPTNPALVARFIANVLEKSTKEQFLTTKWDYRDSHHHVMVQDNPPKAAVAKVTLAKL